MEAPVKIPHPFSGSLQHYEEALLVTSKAALSPSLRRCTLYLSRIDPEVSRIQANIGVMTRLCSIE
jgi:hypothetical protein